MSCAVATLARQPAIVSGARPAGILRRQCACGQHTIGGATCNACRERGHSSPGTSGPSRPHKGQTDCVEGKLVPKVFNEHVLGNCVRLHEDTHKADPRLAEMCRRVTKCNERGDGGIPPDRLDPTYPKDMLGNQCQSTYDQWLKRNEADTELPAYTAEKACLDQVIDAQCGKDSSKARNIGGGIGAATLGTAGGVGGAFAGVAIAQATSKSGGSVGGLVAGGLIGGILGAGIGTGLGWLAGGAIGKAAAGSQGSDDDCAKVRGELKECEIAIAEYQQMIGPEPLPFEPNGQLTEDLLRGITTRKAPGPGAQLEKPKASNELAAIAGRRGQRATLQRLARGGTSPEAIPPVVDEVLASPGSGLDPATRHLMERSFAGNFSRTPALAGAQSAVIGPADDNFEHEARRQAARLRSEPGARSARAPVSQARHDFTGVRVHTGGQAAAAARSVNADAFTLGDHIVFGNGQYTPETATGRQLIAHELTHVVQQNHAPASIQRVGFGQAIARFFGGGTFSDEELKDYLGKLEKTQKIEGDYDSDNKAREVVRLWKAGKAGYTVLVVPIRVLLINEMADGYLSGDDQSGILDLLRESIPSELAYIIPRIGIDQLKTRFDGDKRKKLDGLIENQEMEGLAAAAKWTVAGVKQILTRQGDESILRLIVSKGIKVFRFLAATETWKYSDGHTEDEEALALQGSREGDVIRLRDPLPNERAAKTLFHEATHYTSKVKDDAEQEIQVRIETEKFLIRHGLPPAKKRYRTAAGAIDEAAIRKDIAGSSEYSPTGRERVGIKYSGEKEETGWEVT
jgi:hypothetical protein